MWMEATAMDDSDKTAQSAQIAPRSIDSAALFTGGNELIIIHNGSPYRLRITRQDKLILTK
ncbi:MAG: Hemin uptake protein [Devosia sp.]|nr:Hemin uptake protein [Devosia sp.]